MKTYVEPKSGEWIRPQRRGYRLKCCDCGLVHLMDFKVEKNGRRASILVRYFRDNRATAAARRIRAVKPLETTCWDVVAMPFHRYKKRCRKKKL